jgi:uroporphyrin-3 C-methyltransferase
MPDDSPEQDLTDAPETQDTAPEAADEAVEQAPPRKGGGRFLAALALLVGLAGAGGAGYLYYLLIHTDPQSAVNARIMALETELRSREDAVEALERRQADALAEFAETQRRARNDHADQLLEAVNQLATQAPPSRREWKVAEVAYLLRIANHRLLMERDAGGALALLKGADAILAELDDFSLFQVRAQLADEIVSLEAVETGDLQGLFLRLEAVKTELGRKPVRLPRFEEGAPGAEPEEQGFWSAVLEQIGSYVRFRRFEGEGVEPLLAPEEAVYLEMNLRLMLERTQLAALRREQVIFQQSLATASDWIATYLDTDDPGIRRALDELEALAGVQLDQPLPDISGSLTALQALGEV